MKIRLCEWSALLFRIVTFFMDIYNFKEYSGTVLNALCLEDWEVVVMALYRTHKSKQTSVKENASRTSEWNKKYWED